MMVGTAENDELDESKAAEIEATVSRVAGVLSVQTYEYLWTSVYYKCAVYVGYKHSCVRCVIQSVFFTTSNVSEGLPLFGHSR